MLIYIFNNNYVKTFIFALTHRFALEPDDMLEEIEPYRVSSSAGWIPAMQGRPQNNS